MRNPSSKIIYIVVALWLLLGHSNLLFPQDNQPPDPPVQQDDPSDNPDIPRNGWLLRAMEAMVRASEPELEDVQWLSERLLHEQHRSGQIILVHCLLKCHPDFVYVLSDADQVQWLLDRAGEDNLHYRKMILELLQRVSRTDKGKKVERWIQWWEKNRKGYIRQHSQYIQNLIQSGKYTPPQALSGIPILQPALVPRTLRNLLDLLEEKTDVVICIDDSQSMGPWIAETSKATFRLILLLRELSNDARVGLLTYKDEVNLKLAFTRKHEATGKFLEMVYASGGFQGREGVCEAMQYAASEVFYDWRKDSFRSILLVGDAKAHGTTTWVNAARDVNKTTGIHISTLAVKKNYPDGWEDVPMVGNGVAYCMDDSVSMYEKLIFAVTGAHKHEVFRDLINLLIPILLEDYTLSKSKK